MQRQAGSESSGNAVGGVAGVLLNWFRGRLRVRHRRTPRLVVLERLALGPRQSLVLVEAEGRRLLVATSPEGTPAFYSLDEPLSQVKPGPVSRISRPGPVRPATVDRDARGSW